MIVFDKSLLSRYHVNSVPLPIRPIFYLYGYAIPFLGFLYLLTVRWTSKIEVIGKENLESRPNHILCLWHAFVFLYLVAFPRNQRHAWMQHPTWYMKPSHVMLRFIGVRKIILGSTGHSGKQAAEKLAAFLRQGYSTVLLPDGPNGPPFRMKKGVLHISMQSQVPILPMRLECSHVITLRNWDHRRLPLPFSTFTLRYGEPVQVDAAHLETARDAILKFLG